MRHIPSSQSCCTLLQNSWQRGDSLQFAGGTRNRYRNLEPEADWWQLEKKKTTYLSFADKCTHWKNKLVVLTVEGLSCMVAASWRDRGCGRFTLLVLHTIIAQGNNRGSYPDHLNYPAHWLTFVRKIPVCMIAATLKCICKDSLTGDEGCQILWL